MRILSSFGITRTITASAVLILVIALLAVYGVVSRIIDAQIEQQTLDGQNASLRTAATIIEREIPGTRIEWASDGNVARIVMDAVPQSFAEHAMIDAVARMTGQTATIFAWDAAAGDFFRRTTNIKKADGSRAVGTPLGQKGAVFPFAVKGQTYRGEAVILDVPYYTIYQPIFSPAGKVVGILYAGVRSAEINAVATHIMHSIGLVALVVLTLAGLTIALLVQSIVGPLPRLTAVADRLAQGETDLAVPDRTLGNEIGALARSLDVFRENAVQKVVAEQRATEAVAERERERASSEMIKAEGARAVEDAVACIASHLNSLSAGDLTVRIDQPFAGDLDRLRVDFNAAVERLGETMAQLLSETDGIASGSRELRSATGDLSHRTEQQAASLEETSAALQEIAATVRTSSEKADEATRLSLKARESTENSGRIVARAVEAMSRLETSSGEIAKIINVIDEIAFQTNLLALNAGVEAARTGEAGRGFAVVAQEVRELAQRSARAAADIKLLIAKSGEAVAGGVTLVQQTGTALGEIAGQVAAISDHITAMAATTREQAIAINDINGSVHQMDQFTQRNAAMAEQSTAATHRLADGARNLAELIAQFRTLDAPAPAPDRAEPSLRRQPSHAAGSPARRMMGKLSRAFG